jgi:hypothetical protein
MNKKVLYGIILLSIFLMSAATTVQPVQGYKFGVPDQAKGVESESEIKVYDEDQWESCMGHDGDEPDDIWDGDSDVVGAKAKSKVIDWEKDDEISFFWDFVMETEIDAPPPLDTLEVYKDAIDFIAAKITSLSNIDMVDPSNNGPLTLINLTVQGITIPSVISLPGIWYWSSLGNMTLAGHIAQAFGAAYAYAATEAYAKALYDKEAEGTMVTLDTWEYYEGEYPAEPDEEDDDGPFLDEPEALWESYETLVDLKTDIYGKIDAVVAAVEQANATLAAAKAGTLQSDPTTQIAWGIINRSIGGILGMMNPTLPGFLYGYGFDDLPELFLDAIITATGNNVLSEGASPDPTKEFAGAGGSPGIVSIEPLFETYIPKAGGYLYMALEGGYPVYTPTGKFLVNLVEEFEDDIEDSEDVPENAHPAMDGTIPFEVSVDVDKEAMTVTMEFDFDDYPDPYEVAKGESDPDEIEDWEVTFYYGEYGSQSKVEYKHGDEIFYSKEGLAVIPGFEITIILGASAVAILGCNNHCNR